MNITQKIGIALSAHIQNSTKVPAEKIMKLIDEYKQQKQQSEDIIEQQKNIYVSLFQNPRLENDIKYNSYLAERSALYENWKKNGDKASLIEVLKISKPIMQNIPDIYTYTMVNPYQKERKPSNERKLKPQLKPLKTKDCPEGKILNPITNRCVNAPKETKKKRKKLKKRL